MQYAAIAGSRASFNGHPQIITSRRSGRRQTIFRAGGDGKPSTTLSNVALADPRLSCEALGALARIMKLPDDWTFNVAWFCRTFGMGKDRAWRILRELETNGYMKRAQQRDANGRLGRAEYLFTDDPSTWHELAELPHPEKPCTVNPPPTKKRDLHDRSVPDAPEVSEEAITEAAAMAPHVDVRAAVRRWQSWTTSNRVTVLRPDRAFLAWFPSHVAYIAGSESRFRRRRSSGATTARTASIATQKLGRDHPGFWPWIAFWRERDTGHITAEIERWLRRGWIDAPSPFPPDERRTLRAPAQTPHISPSGSNRKPRDNALSENEELAELC